MGDKVGDKSNKDSLYISQVRVLAEIRNNPNITKPQLMAKCEIGKTALYSIIKLFFKQKRR